MTPRPANSRPPAPMRSPWRTVVAFGMVSLAADMVYEGHARRGRLVAGLAGLWVPEISRTAADLVLRRLVGTA